MNRIKIALLLSSVFASNSYAGDQLINQAKKAEIKSCLSTIDAVEEFFTKDQSYGSASLWAVENSDDQIFTSTLELTFSDGPQIIDLTVAPTKDGQCSYSYTRTFYSEKSCMAYSKANMKNAEYSTELNKYVTKFDDGSSNWFLSSAGVGCLIQKKEIGLRFKPQAL
ncbi:hypothetical protein CWC11_15725 [Pseudoalteromonas sp. S3178]|uniref:hypothetical protein n=1 Tax=Pseudoalteromonas sp. S3178 TaxID=579532 RepID=UPI00110A29B2|nr:hypothetical protein [Pseudoalteromonas sp. S3178]TMP02949.1 hypothetical protein CWC11_15725 [Pseudoalteromonas sp. S3178]